MKWDLLLGIGCFLIAIKHFFWWDQEVSSWFVGILFVALGLENVNRLLQKKLDSLERQVEEPGK
jgi:hypothetical protein